MMRRTLGSKWIKTKLLLQNQDLRRFVPETHLFSKASLLSMLNKYSMVYIKPIHGSFGIGVMRVTKTESENGKRYHYQSGLRKRSFASYQAMYQSILQTKPKKSYLVQQGIHMLKYKSRPFDIRIMVQRTAHLPWKVTGWIGRLAYPKKVVTNFHSQGKPLPVKLLLSPHLSDAAAEEHISSMKEVGLRIAEQLSKTQPGFREIGVDIGFSSDFHPWVFEVNTSPDPFIFNQLKDKSMFYRVIKYARANGRFRKKK
ncbi:YheC/YheD family protein [Paenibacillus cremeus]|uniref:YheC/YheD family protein n=1 Tax=Paenibacillus cremeus TaxID=2163881 RepID=A0A559K9T1_9BACL|nr:YheC/YheD family protein [Paenibacillus cremeus]TVY08876.1 hypothetical protein FPZ49_16520 [Paenibacillus cremeus]